MYLSYSMMTKATLAICLVGAIGSLAIGFGGIGWSLMSVEDALIFPLVVGPYALIGGLVWWRRTSPRESFVLLVTVLLIAIYGFWAFGVSFHSRYSNPQGQTATDLTPLVVPMLQWLVTMILTLLLGAAAAIRSFTIKPSP